LLSAVFEGDEPSPALLAAYARNPGSLSAEARREIERALEGRPDLLDEVRTLRSFVVPELSEPAVGRAPLRSRWRRVPLWASAAAAALLVFALTPPAQRWLQSSGGTSGPAVVPTPGEQQAALEPAPAPEAPAPSPSVEPPKPPTPRPPEPDLLAGAEAPAPAPPTAREPASTGAQVAVQEPAERPSEPATPDAPVPLPVAMLEPSYQRPPEALDRRRIVVAMRGPTDGVPELAALAPAHVAFTRSASPELFWSMSGRAPEGAKVLLRILEERSGDALIETELPAPDAPGVQRVRLTEQGASLAPGVVYTWYVVLRLDPENPARDRLAQGWIQRRDVDVGARDPGALPAELARVGLWYDALAAALALRAQEPDNASVERGVRALLEQGGVAVEP
jgi:hypothetical protein